MWVATAEMEEQQQVLPFFSRQSWASGIFECTRSPHSTWQNASLHRDWKQRPGQWCFRGNRSEIHQSGSMPCPLPDRPLGQQIRNACPYTSTQTCGLCHPLLCMKTLPQEIAKLTLVGITWTFLLQMKEKRKSLRKFASWAPPKVFQAWHVMESQPATQETPLPALWSRPPEHAKVTKLWKQMTCWRFMGERMPSASQDSWVQRCSAVEPFWVPREIKPCHWWQKAVVAETEKSNCHFIAKFSQSQGDSILQAEPKMLWSSERCPVASCQ